MNLTHSFAVLSDKRRVILGKHQILTYSSQFNCDEISEKKILVTV